MKKMDGGIMVLLIIFLLSLTAAGLCVWLAGLALWQGALLLVGCYVALNLLFAVFWIVVSLFVDKNRPLEKQSKICRVGCASISGWLCSLFGLRVTFTGEERLPAEGHFLLVSNHRSGFDPLVTTHRLRHRNMAFISKPSNMNLPCIGRLAYGAGFLAIDRENDRKALKTILTAADYLKRGLCSVGVYPEGTRSKTEELLPFHAGSFKIAQKAGVPLVIAAIRGTEHVFGNFPLKRTPVELRILETIPAEQVKGMSTQELAAHSRERIEAFLRGDAREAAE